MEIRRKMFGSAGAEEAVAAAGDFTQKMQELVTRYCFGEIWARPLLDHKTRSLLTLAIVATLSRPNQFKGHVKGAIVNGATPEEIREVLLHTMIYAGVPVAVDSFGAAEEVLKELNLK
ncbi:carboxymuconolactone decarboxylase family protein [Variovorax paradoxus]|nr:carboxymuconolactone decarboxylase family protein [Variovorax paradoxus]